MILSCHSPAKLNLFLHITGKRLDGYHNLQSVFCRLQFGDTLHFRLNADSTDLISLTGADHLTASLDDNLIIKAVHALHAYATTHRPEISLTPVAIKLVKRIPTGAGLGGGSSNAGTTLLALNTLWGLHFDTQTLIHIAVKLGADVPFFVLNHPSAIAEGIGEKLTPIDLPPCRFLLICPPVHNPTQRFFADTRLKKDSPPLIHDDIIADRYLWTLSPPFFNAFETIAKDSPQICTALAYLQQLSHQTHTTPRLTGTGSTVFLPIPLDIDDKTLTTWQKNAPFASLVTQIY